MNTAFQKVYTKITQITKATCSLKAQGVGNDELAIVNGRLAQVVKIWGEDITLQVFSGTEGIPTNAEVTFLGKAPTLKVGEDLCGRFFNAFGDPIDGGPAVDGEEREIGGPSVNPVRRKQPSELIATGIAGIDLNNTLVSGQKIPFFADADQPYNQVMANVALRAQTDRIILGGMGLTNDDYLYFKNLFDNAGVLDRIVSFVNTTEAPPVERLLVPDMALTAAEYLAYEKDMHVLVIMTDMTNYCEALREVSAARREVPGRRGYPGYLYTNLSTLYERAGRLVGKKGSVTQIPILSMPEDDITHPIPDLTGYITEGQIILSRELDKKGVQPPINVLPSLSRLKDKGIGKGKTREDHADTMNQLFAAYSRGKDAKELMAILGESALSEVDLIYAKFADEFEKRYVSQGFQTDRTIEQTLETGWDLLRMLPRSELKRIRDEYLEKYLNSGE